ncbi:hypothetical protein AX14_004387 [Amanita brunnescens Koide BX004]|nr:hypothetical protein AX14_004387 [Amanita brunnescens Koide BX004]
MWADLLHSPIIGGFLSRPAARWPDTLGRLAFLKNHPYFLPCLAAAIIAFASFIGGFVALKETSPAAISRRERKKTAQPDRRTLIASDSTRLTDSDGTDYGTNRNYCLSTGSLDSLTDVEDRLQTHEEDQKSPAFRALLTPETIALLVNYALFTFLDMSLQALLPLMWSTSVKHGGLGFSPFLIGMTMGAYGMFSALVQLTLLGPLIRRYGARKVYIAGFSFLLVTFLGYPIAGYFARRAGHADWKVWCVIAIQLAANAAVPTTYGAVQVMVQDLSPSKSALGAMNGLAQAVASGARGLGPSVASSLHRVNRSLLPSYRTPSPGSEDWSPDIVTNLSSSLLSDLGEDEDTITQSYMRFRNDCGNSGAKSAGLIGGPVTPHQSSGRNIAMPRRDSGNTSVHPRSLSMDTSPFTWSETPEVSPSAKVLDRGASASDRQTPLPGCIFDYEDPWDAIGIIMGLPRNELRNTNLEEELTALDANGHIIGIAASDDNFRLSADILTESYSDSTSSTRFSSQFAQESQISDSTCSPIFAEDSSVHEDSSIDYVTPGLYEDRFDSSLDQTSSCGSVSPPHEVRLEPLNPCAKDNPISPVQTTLVQNPELPADTVTDNSGLPYTGADLEREISSMTHVLSPSHPDCSHSLRPIDGDYGLNLFSDESDVESP